MALSWHWHFLSPRVILILITVCLSTGCAVGHRPREAFFQPASFKELPKWNQDTHFEAFRAFLKSCEPILKKRAEDNISPLTQLGGKSSAWQKVCVIAHKSSITNSLQAKKFFEKWFRPYGIKNQERSSFGKMTGYYEIELEGSRRQTKKYKYPIYRAPTNITKLKGNAGFCHASINRGVLRNQQLEIAWVNQLSKLCFLHIQGSGIIRLSNGSALRIRYDNQNGFPYTGIGSIFKRYRIKAHSPLQMMSWIEQNPKLGLRLMEENKSYVFFKESLAHSAIGAQGVELTAGRSIAIDAKFYPYGALFWINTHIPTNSGNRRVQSHDCRLMVAQDTGGSINGAVRADIFFGRGRKAETLASAMHHQGSYYILVPNSVKMPKRYRTH